LKGAVGIIGALVADLDAADLTIAHALELLNSGLPETALR